MALAWAVSEKVEKEVLKDGRKRVSLEGRVPPSAALLTWLDAEGDQKSTQMIPPSHGRC